MKRVLVVEDDPDLATLLRKIFTLSGAEVTVAADGADALEKLAEMTPDAIITDLNMPNVDGLELCRRLQMRTDLSHIPVLVYTAVGSLDPRVAEMNSIPNVQVASKPMPTRSLIDKIAALLNGPPQQSPGAA